MGQGYNDLLSRLKLRFDSGFAEYKREILRMGKLEIFEAAPEIVAAKETHVEMCFWLEMSMHEGNLPDIFCQGPISVHEAEKLLLLENPLKTLAMKWCFHTLGGKTDFHEFYQSEIKPAFML